MDGAEHAGGTTNRTRIVGGSLRQPEVSAMTLFVGTLLQSVAAIAIKPLMECNAAMTPAGIGGRLRVGIRGMDQICTHRCPASCTLPLLYPLNVIYAIHHTLCPYSQLKFISRNSTRKDGRSLNITC
jgi:hypothetical protein